MGDGKTRRYIGLIIGLTLLALLVLPLTVSADGSETVRVGIYENAPKIFTDAEGNPSGLWPDIVDYIASEEGWEVEWVHGTWPQCKERLETGEIDIMPDVGYTEERSERYAFQNETTFTSWSRVYVTEESEIQSIHDLENSKIAVLKDSVNYVGPDGIKELTEEFDVDCTFTEADDYHSVFELVEKGKADAGVVNKNFGNRYEQEYDVDRTAIVFQPSELKFAFPKGAALTPYLIERIDHHVKELKEGKDSIYYQSLEKHLGVGVVEESVFPEWAKWTLVGIAGIVILLGAGTLVLRRQVRSGTRELKRSESLLSQTQYLAQVGGWEYDVREKTMTWTDEVYRVYGVSRDNYDPNDVQQDIEFYAPEDRETIEQAFFDAVNKGEPYELELRLSTANGERRWVRTIGNPVVDGGEVIRVVGHIMDITDRKRNEAALHERQRFLHDTLEAIQDGIIVLDTSLNIKYVNSVMNNWYADNRPLEGKKCYECYHNREEPCAPCPSLRCIETGDTERDIVPRLPGSDVEWIELFSYPMKDPDTGEVTGVVEFVRDITERKQAEQELHESRVHLEERVEERTAELTRLNEQLQWANKRLQELDRLKSMFIASMSHELRTPLNSIIGFTGVLLQELPGELNEEQRKQLLMVKSSSQHLLDLINDVIDISKIEAGQAKPHISTFDLAALVGEIVNSFSVNAKQRGLDLSLDVPETLEVESDRRRVRQVVMNYLSNALKFTEEGEIEVSVETAGDLAVIRVRDTGIGIREEDINKLFAAFSRITTSGQPQEGTGLGLYLCKRIADLLGGSAYAESTYGEGSTFVFEMPLVYKGDIS